MPSLPSKIFRGDALDHEKINQIIDYLAALTPMDSTSGPTVTPSGTVYPDSPQPPPPPPPHSFKATRTGDTVTIARGFRGLVGGALTEVAETSFTFTAGNFVWLTFTHRTTPAGSGSWSSLTAGASPPDESETVAVRIICEMTGDAPYVFQRTCGDIIIPEIITAQGCP